MRLTGTILVADDDPFFIRRRRNDHGAFGKSRHAACMTRRGIAPRMVLRGDFHGALDRNAIPIDQLDTRHEGGVMKARDGFRDDILPFVSFKAGLHLERQEGSHLGKVSGQNVVCVQVA
ncbi:MAG TPA: hypothetical protein VHR44_00505 [Beijerinckiaceae bacterium]|nr:hypothetical protein [Beijerinckiaceae bacterium]